MSSAQNYSYYRYHRRVVSSARAAESIRDYPYPIQTIDGGFRRLQRVAPPPSHVFEEEIREEFRTWPSQTYAVEAAGPAMDALEREVAELRNEVKELSRKIDLSLSSAQKQQESDIRSGVAEKMERLKQELRELKALLEQLKREK
jgi:predicted RNase H-like nuclease (RuvC/YqgF family)